jgi:hypothetical protein
MIVRDYIMFKGSKLSAMDLMSKNLMIMIKSMQNKMKEIFKHNFYKCSLNKKVPPERKISMLKFG